MSESYRVTALDVVGGMPHVIARVPTALKSVIAARRKIERASLGMTFQETVAKFGERPALYFEDRMFSYKELNAEANKLAHFLVSQGVKRGDVVALLMQNRPEFLVSFLAIAKAGACTALLNNTQTGEVLTHSINLVSPVAVIVGEELIQPFNEVRKDICIAEGQIYSIADSDIREANRKVPEGFRNIVELASDENAENLQETKSIKRSDHLCYIYTSGTTGMPKATITDHNRFCTVVQRINIAKNLSPKDIYYVALPLYHATGLLACWGSVIGSGSSMVIKRKFSASEFWDDIDKYKATIFGYVGELCRYLLNQPPRPEDGKHTLKKMFGNGLRPGIWMEFKKRFKVPYVLEFYGASEGNAAFMNLLNLDNTIGVGAATLVKYDIENDEVIRDAKGKMIKVGKGEPGLLLGKITRRTPFNGYTQADKTEKAIFRDVFKKGDAWFNTGDLLRNIGYAHYQFVDRLGDTFRWKGENVSTTQVENILGAHPDIEDCVVYGVKMPEDNGKAGMAAITPRDSAEIDFGELFGYLSGKLPSYAVPVFIRLKTKADLTGTFKYQKSELKKESFSRDSCPDTVYVALPGTLTYVELTEAIQKGVYTSEYRF